MKMRYTANYPWRIHGTGILMLTWLGYIDGKYAMLSGKCWDFTSDSPISGVSTGDAAPEPKSRGQLSQGKWWDP